MRELYAVDDDHLLLVASDRLSAYDVVLPTAIPDKGAVLTGLSLWWFGQLADLVPDHLVTADVTEYPAELRPWSDDLRGRSMLCRRLDMQPVECVARGYLTGSGLADYRATGAVCGVAAARRARRRLAGCPSRSSRPATKAEVGEHDENVSFDGGRRRRRARARRGAAAADPRGLRAAAPRSPPSAASCSPTPSSSSALDRRRRPDPRRRGADPGLLALLAGRHVRAGAAAAVVRQAVRPRLARRAPAGTAPPRAPSCPADVVEQTRARYVEAYERLTGSSFDSYLREA